MRRRDHDEAPETKRYARIASSLEALTDATPEAVARANDQDRVAGVTCLASNADFYWEPEMPRTTRRERGQFSHRYHHHRESTVGRLVSMFLGFLLVCGLIYFFFWG